MSDVEIYTVTYDFNRWRYTSADENVYVEPVTFRAVPITRSNIELSTDETGASFTVSFPLDAEFLELFRVSPPSGLVTLLCEKFDVESGQTVEIVFKGRIVNVAWQEDHAEVTCESSSQAIRRMGLRRHYQYGCPHMLFGGECRVDREQFVTVGNATNLTNIGFDLLEAAGKDDGYYAGGYVEYMHSELQTTERIAVAESEGASGRITLFSFPIGLAAGAEVRLYAGCDRTLQTCAGKFNNAENYGGMPFIPTKDPFGGDPLY